MQIGITYSRSAYSLLIKYSRYRSDKSENLISLANKQDEQGSDMEHLDVVGLLRAVQILERNMSVALMYSGLRIPQFRMLNVLSQAGQATVTEMSEKLHVTRATASVMALFAKWTPMGTISVPLAFIARARTTPSAKSGSAS